MPACCRVFGEQVGFSLLQNAVVYIAASMRLCGTCRSLGFGVGLVPSAPTTTGFGV